MSNSKEINITKADDLIILLWGLCGVGKSNIINQCGATAEYIDANGQYCERKPEVGKGFRPTTRDVVPYTFTHTFSGRTRRVTLVDLPGLDDEEHEAGEIFEQVTYWLWAVHRMKRSKPFLTAFIYVLPLGQVMSKSQVHCFRLLEHMCGAEARKQLFILSTKAEGDDEVQDILESYREEALFQDYQNRIIRRESKREQDPAIDCLRPLWNLDPVPLELLTELDNNIPLLKTTAGLYLRKEMLDKTLLKLEKEKTKYPSNSNKHKEIEEKVNTKRREITRLSNIDKKALLRTTSKWSHRTAGTVAGVGAAFLVSPVAIHVGLPILGAAAFLELAALGSGLGADAIEARERRSLPEGPQSSSPNASTSITKKRK